ncbi:MAG: Bacterial SH3 domain protein [Chloroflexi bacterium OLB15]|nr:MAG: Bacterial SH3 domain protein [Chloroflexi bacterium OLB15]
MLKRHIILLLTFVLLTIGSTAYAQPVLPDFSGDYAFYTEHTNAVGKREGEVLFLDPFDVVTAVPVPAGFYPDTYTGRTDDGSPLLTNLVTSPDGRFLAGTFQLMEVEQTLPIVIADLAANTCCVTLSPLQESVSAYSLGGFEPETNVLAYSYVGYVNVSSDSFRQKGGMAAADPETGDIIAQMDMAVATGAPDPASAPPWAMMGGWQDGAAYFTPSCYACEGVIQAERMLWNPFSNEVDRSTGVYFSIFGDRLASTGEFLVWTQVPGLPADPTEGMFPVPNAIVYQADGVLPPFGTSFSGAVVYSDPTTLNLSGGAHWVQNGAQYLVTPDGDIWTLVNRDGTRIPISGMTNNVFYTGTPNGWIGSARVGTGHVLTRYTLEAGSIINQAFTITEDGSPFAPGGYRITYAPPLAGTGFPAPQPIPIIPPVPTAAPSTTNIPCAGFIPMLSPGIHAQVTPGDPNNIRSGPTTSAAVIGQIPGGQIVSVVAGPYCAEGIGFWLVEFNGITGYTAEGRGSTYYMFPLG